MGCSIDFSQFGKESTVNNQTYPSDWTGEPMFSSEYPWLNFFSNRLLLLSFCEQLDIMKKQLLNSNCNSFS